MENKMSILNKIFPMETYYKVTTAYKKNVLSETEVTSLDKALSFFPTLTEEEKERFEYYGFLPMQIGENIVTIEKKERASPPKKIYEARLRHDDPEMQEYHQERHDNRRAREVEKEQHAAAPYAVGWSAQSLEWYGSDDPSTGQGRYKSKGDGGRVVAINVPSYQEAESIEKSIDNKEREGTLDPHLGSKHGDDHYILHYHGPWIKSMNELDDYDKIHLKYDNPEDYSQQGQPQ
jgi:hypothetical protein